jgi:hypothetical protein
LEDAHALVELTLKARLTPAAVAVIAVLCGAQGAGAGTTSHCPLTPHRTIAATKSVRVYRAFSRTSGTIAAYACVVGSKRRVFLDVDSQDNEFTVTHVQIAGRFVAFFSQYQGREGASPDLKVVDVRSGKVVRKETDGEIQSPIYTLGVALLLSPTGSVAWISEERERATGNLLRRVVETADRNGRRVLDADPAIDPSSLALATGWVYWRHGDETRSAPVS